MFVLHCNEKQRCNLETLVPAWCRTSSQPRSARPGWKKTATTQQNEKKWHVSKSSWKAKPLFFSCSTYCVTYFSMINSKTWHHKEKILLELKVVDPMCPILGTSRLQLGEPRGVPCAPRCTCDRNARRKWHRPITGAFPWKPLKPIGSIWKCVVNSGELWWIVVNSGEYCQDQHL